MTARAEVIPMFRRFTTGFVLLLATLPAQRAVGAPSNDLIENAVTITSLPYSVTMSTVGATEEPLFEPFSWCGSSGASVWFRYVVADSGPLELHTRGSDFDTVLNVYRRMPSGGLQEVNCNDDEYRPNQEPPETSWVAFSARAGDELYMQAAGASISGDPRNAIGAGETGILVLSVASSTNEDLPFRPPLHDDRASATTISILPFGDGVHLNSASGEPQLPEESSCRPSDSATNGRNFECRTVWYLYDADRDLTLAGRAHSWFGAPTFVAYLETAEGFVELAHSEPGSRNAFMSEYDYDVAHAMFDAAAGDRIWIQLSRAHNDADFVSSFTLREAPVVDFSVDALTIEPGSDPSQAKEVTARLSMSQRSAFIYEFVACPVGAPSAACFTIAYDYGQLMWYEGTSTSVARSWYAAGCVGDFDITARVWWPYSIDPDPTNNSATTRISIIAPPTGAGAGYCPFL